MVSYGYTVSGTNTSAQISTYTSEIGNNRTEWHYTYDGRGNITQIKDENDVIQYQYAYDDLGQLTREDNRASETTLSVSEALADRTKLTRFKYENGWHYPEALIEQLLQTE